MAVIATEEQTGTFARQHHGEHYSPRTKSEQKDDRIEETIQTVQRDPEYLYELWSKLELTPRWQEYVVSVTPTSPTLSHWVVGDPSDADGKRIEFDSEIVESVPGSRLAWKSITPEVPMDGSVTFEATARGTRVTLVQNGKIPFGSFGSAVAGLVKRSPQQVVKENLRHFKQLAETGEIPSVVGQPHGPRGVSGNVKRWMYGETNPTPPGTSTQPAAESR